MNVETKSHEARVVVFARDPSLPARAAAALAQDPDRCWRAPSAYEAAAEALAGQAALLVVELPALRPHELPLPRLYAAHGLPVLGVGTPPASLDLEGLRLVSAEQLPAAIAEALAEPAAYVPVEPEEQAQPPAPAGSCPQSLISPEEMAALLERQP